MKKSEYTTLAHATIEYGIGTYYIYCMEIVVALLGTI